MGYGIDGWRDPAAGVGGLGLSLSTGFDSRFWWLALVWSCPEFPDILNSGGLSNHGLGHCLGHLAEEGSCLVCSCSSRLGLTWVREGRRLIGLIGGWLLDGWRLYPIDGRRQRLQTLQQLGLERWADYRRLPASGLGEGFPLVSRRAVFCGIVLTSSSQR